MRSEKRDSGRLNRIDILSVIAIFYYLFFSLYPLESYLSGGYEEVSLPLPVTTLSLVAVSFLVILYMAQSKGCLRWACGVLPIYIFVAFAFFSVFWAGDPAQALKRSIRYFPTVALGVIFAQYYSIKKILTLMVIALAMTAVLGIFFSVAIPSLGVSRIGGGYENAWRGLQVHKNFTGDVMAVGILIAVGGWITNNISARLALFALVPAAVLLIKSNSGTAITSAVTAIAIALCLWSIRRVPPSWRPLVSAIFIYVTFVICVIVCLNVDGLFGSAGRDMTFTGRTYVWEAVWIKIWEHPLRGWGYGLWTASNDSTSDWIRKMVGDTAAHSHNTWLDVWLQLGLIPLIIVACCCLMLLYNSIRRLLRHDERECIVYILLGLYILMRSSLEIQFTDPWTAEMFWLTWALVRLEVVRMRFEGRIKSRSSVPFWLENLRPIPFSSARREIFNHTKSTEQK